MTQFVWAVIGFLLTGVLLILLVLLPGITVAFPLLLGALTFLALAYATIILLVLVALVFARILEATPSGLPFWLVSFLYLVAVGLLFNFVLLPLHAAVWVALITGPGAIAPLTVFANSFLQAAAYLLLSTVVMFGPFIVIHFLLALATYVFSASMQTGSNTPTADESNGRGFVIGMNAAANMFLAGGVYFWLLLPALGLRAAALIALVIVILIFVAAVRCIFWPTSGFTKGFIGWLMLVMPMALGAEALGWLIFTFNLLGHVLFSWIPGVPAVSSFCTVQGVNVRGDTGSVVSLSGIASIFAPVPTAYTTGRFVVVTFYSLPTIPPGRLLHEVGHHLNSAALGDHWCARSRTRPERSASSGFRASASPARQTSSAAPSRFPTLAIQGQPVWSSQAASRTPPTHSPAKSSTQGRGSTRPATIWLPRGRSSQTSPPNCARRRRPSAA
jgi:hypothetical protein